MKLILLLLFASLTSVLSKQWIDPHDMNTNAREKLKKALGTYVPETGEEKLDCNCDTVEENHSFIYLKRLASLFLNSAHIDVTNPLTYHGKLFFNLDKEDIQFLTEFVRGQDPDLNKLRKLDSILSDMLHPSLLDEISDRFFASQERFLNILFSKKTLPLVGLCIALYISYNLFKSNFSPWYVFRYLIFIVVVVDFIQRYQYLTEDAEKHNLHIEYSSACDTAKMSWVEYFKYLTQNNDCEKKVITLLEVFLMQVKSVIIVPLASIGTGMGEFGSGLWNKLPFPWNILIFPVMLIFCFIILSIILTAVNNTPFKFNLMHLLHLEFGKSNTSKQGVSEKILDKLLDAVNHKSRVEIIERESKKVELKKNEKESGKKKTKLKQIKNKENDHPKKEDLNSSESCSETSFVKVKSCEIKSDSIEKEDTHLKAEIPSCSSGSSETVRTDNSTQTQRITDIEIMHI